MKSSKKFSRKITKRGNSLGITLPKDIAKWLNIKSGDTIHVTPEERTTGNYITLWKKEENT